MTVVSVVSPCDTTDPCESTCQVNRAPGVAARPGEDRAIAAHGLGRPAGDDRRPGAHGERDGPGGRVAGGVGGRDAEGAGAADVGRQRRAVGEGAGAGDGPAAARVVDLDGLAGQVEGPVDRLADRDRGRRDVHAHDAPRLGAAVAPAPRRGCRCRSAGPRTLTVSGERPDPLRVVPDSVQVIVTPRALPVIV